MFDEKSNTMKLKDVFTKYSTEKKSKLAFKQLRDNQGVCCKKCKGTDHYWKAGKWQYECKNCGFRTTLKSGTVMESSKLPFQYWMVAIALMSATKKSFSALEIQRQLGHDRYEPIWYMLHKIRVSMGKCDDQYQLDGQLEIDEGFFEGQREKERDLPDEESKYSAHGNDGKRQVKVLVMVESERVKVKHKNKTRPKRKVGRLKMKVVERITKLDVDSEVRTHIKPTATAITDGRQCYSNLKDILADHTGYVLNDPELGHQLMPWVHIAISNAKKICLGVHHSIKRSFMQNYLNEFCYKFNRRFNIAKLFELFMIDAVKVPWYASR